MSYCLNPICQQPQNPDGPSCCQCCGSSLWLHDRYLAIALIGQGGFGRTFRAIDAGKMVGKEGGKQSTACVIKQLLPQQHPTAGAERTLFEQETWQQEAKCLQELGQHPQIPALIDFFEQDDRLYLVQEYINGQTLEQVLSAQGAFTEAQIWQLLQDLLPVLKFIHDRQVIHRDIKPANLIQAGDRLFLVDFGAAKLVNPADWLQAGTRIGSAEYVAPEQARGQATFASDLYSLGVTCIHLLTDLSPFDLFDLVNDTWIWRSFLNHPISEALGSVLDRLLQNALSQRFRSAEEVIQALSVSAHPIGLPPTPPAPPPWLCRAILTGHTLSVNTIALSPDGSTLASGSDDKTIRLWNGVTGQPIATLSGHTQAIKSLAFSPDGTLLVSASQDKTLRLWHVQQQKCLQTCVAHSQSVTCVAYHPQEHWLASVSWDKTLKLWESSLDREPLLCLLTGHLLQLTAGVFSPVNFRLIATASYDRTVRLWQIDRTETGFSGKLLHILADHVGAVFTVAFSPDGKLVATGGDDRTIKLWDVDTGRLHCTLAGHSWTITSLVFSPDGKTLISGSWDTSIKLWSIASHASESTRLMGHTDSVQAATISPDGQTIVSASRDTTLRIWQKNS